MAVIWGLDLNEIKWSKFKSSYMWSRKYHLRRTKFIVYQVAMICCVISESLGTAALSDYLDQQDAFKKLDDRALEYNNDIVGIGSYNIFAGVFVATVFGAAFFFDLFWPERYEPAWVKTTWKACAVFACFAYLGASIGLTVIIFGHCAYVTGVDGDRVAYLLQQDSKVPLCYSDSNRSISSAAFSWPGWVAVVGSTIVMWYSHIHDAKYGPLSTNAREAASAERKMEGGAVDGNMTSPDRIQDPEKPVAPSAPAVPETNEGQMDRFYREQDVMGVQQPPPVHVTS